MPSLPSKPAASNLSTLLRLAALFLTLLLPACSQPPEPTAKPTAVATIFSYYDILRSVGGDRINAIILVPASTSPHEYDPPAQAKADVNKAILIVKNGLGIDDWIDKLADGSKAKILDIGKNRRTLRTQETSLTSTTAPDTATERNAKEPESDLGNPHIWLDPTVQIAATAEIRDTLIQLDPLNRDIYTRNAAAYIADLEKLDADFKAAAKSFKQKDFIGFHSAYDYLAHRYGLRQVAAIEELPGSPTPAQTQKIIDLIKQKNVKAVFTESALDAKPTEMIVRETGIKTHILQPLETYDNLNDTYVSLMRQNLQSLKEALNQ